MPVTEAQKRATAKYEKENYDKVLVRFPKGTKERIQNAGAESVNGYIIRCVLDSLKSPQETQTEPINAQAEEVPQEKAKEPKKAYKEPTKEELQELQKLISQKKAEQDRRAEELRQQKEEQEPREREERQAEIMEHLERIRNGEAPEEDAEKEELRQESIIQSALPY